MLDQSRNDVMYGTEIPMQFQSTYDSQLKNSWFYFRCKRIWNKDDNSNTMIFQRPYLSSLNFFKASVQRASRRTSHSFSVVASSPKRFFHFSRPWKKLSSTPYSLWFTQIFSISGSLRPSFRRTFFHLAPISSRMQWKWSSVAGCLSLPSEDISQLKDSVWLAEESAKK